MNDYIVLAKFENGKMEFRLQNDDYYIFDLLYMYNNIPDESRNSYYYNIQYNRTKLLIIGDFYNLISGDAKIIPILYYPRNDFLEIDSHIFVFEKHYEGFDSIFENKNIIKLLYEKDIHNDLESSINGDIFDGYNKITLPLFEIFSNEYNSMIQSLYRLRELYKIHNNMIFILEGNENSKIENIKKEKVDEVKEKILFLENQIDEKIKRIQSEILKWTKLKEIEISEKISKIYNKNFNKAQDIIKGYKNSISK